MKNFCTLKNDVLNFGRISEVALLFKVGLLTFKEVGVISVNGRPLKLINNAFYFTLKALFVLKVFTLHCLEFLVIYENTLIRKLR